MKKKVVVIGNGMVGYKFCEKLVAQAADQFQIIVFGEEPRPAYDRVHLSEYFGDQSEENLTLAPRAWYEEQGIELRTGELVTSISPADKTITTHKGSSTSYDFLVLATGSSPFVPPIKGVDKAGVFVYRTIEDLDAIIEYGEKMKKEGHKKASVLGGGLLGLEAAKALYDLDLEPTVIEFAPRLMPRQLDKAGAKTLQDTIEGLGIQVLTNKSTSEIQGNGRLKTMQFADGLSHATQMLVISAGIRPRDELARQAHLLVGPRGGVVVDHQMRTSEPSIFAIGEVALYQEKIYGLVAPGYDMAAICVAQLLGEDSAMEGEIDMSTKLKLIGVDVASFGDALGEIGESRAIVYADKHKGLYKRINVSTDGKRLLGGILVGDAADYNMLLQMTQLGLPLPPHPEDLILGPRNGEGAAMGSVLDLPDNALICACESLSKGQLTAAICEKGCDTFKGLCQETKASTGCGGCKPMVNDLLRETLKSMGKTVKAHICEHFPYSRQELFDLIQVKGIANYDQALDELGQGDGCETCKPALASVFASLYNETAVVQETIQDTNDRFLANIQRNGTYSVVPRVPAGEITPEKLIAIGQIAKKYDLYTKITGGQRVDMFGAKLNDLPHIWEELIAAGFESGHAYGKALRTVKSCVGSTWCRFGMDESVSFAVTLENRYKGLRAPHKLKGGVSGCIRECAEARCKDFGVIATEGGWNLYVCGNGGAKPKHALLLAENIDHETCIRYIDRFLMFYIKTAAPLTRTAAWLEQLEGGIEYLKEVVIQDSLGIAQELEEQMKVLIQSYQCEWKQVVDNPDLQQRFKHFINSEETDDNLSFVPLRDQKMPRPW